MSTSEIFWNILKNFRDDTIVIQLLLIIGALIAFFLAFYRPGKQTDAFVKLFLFFAFAWNGIACFIVYCGKSPTAKFLGGPLYLVVAVLFLFDLFFTKKIKFNFPLNNWRRRISVFLIILSFLFPVFGILTGHGFIALSMFPCPLAGYTLALLCAAYPQDDKAIGILVMIWAFVNISKCFGYVNCYEEIVVVAAAFYYLFLLKTDASPA
ncbi:hypothetical protein HNR65_002430 [Desulfosalsimonas propionicica]|uniref:Uncharacterized protein n=1 Tax=Desulfosalsimonas propionicica TaxID=332175 RepID=A0A7W0CAB4_9BACT|nr:DUF6064 family protein [Desulfosalsimonas propionicica]MBA2882089.1 hypothetical protein [Desulfosalsimonas propionicica]